MDWPAERRTLEVLRAAPTANSSLRRKLAIINRLKSITADALPAIVSDIKSENLAKFYTEITNSLFANARAQSHEEIHNIVRVIYLYSYDPAFMAALTSGAKKVCAESWVHGALFAEIYFLINGRVDAIVRSLLKLYGESTPHLASYLLSSFEGLDTACIRRRIEELAGAATEKNLDVLNRIVERQGWDVKLRVKDDFVEVVRPVPGEFDFYRRDGEPPAGGPAFVNGDVKRIEQERANTRFLDHVAAGVSGKPELIAKVLRKGRAAALAPAVARIVSGLTAGRKEVVSRVVAGDPEALHADDLRLVGELYKFGAVRLADLAALFSHYFKTKSVARLCVLTEGTCRMMLQQREANRYARDLLERLRQLGCAEVERIAISDCISSVLSQTAYKADVLGFLQWFFRGAVFSAGALFRRMAESRALMYVLFCRPELFESAAVLARVVRLAGMERELAALYTEMLGEFLAHSRHRGFRVVEALALLVADAPAGRQRMLIEQVWQKRLPLDTRFQIVLALLEHCDAAIHAHYVAFLAAQSVSTDCRHMLFNFCERHHYDVNLEADSFEQEMACLR
ncbi:hypothetical protein PAPHI01_2092 [Pancytospora philotis]|nr:hypothetical protein PAPHI01_2092 [Pancytospora philotis]